MGTWGPDSFDNDAACDWAAELPEGGMRHVRWALAACLELGAAYLDADIACEGIAACDVVARLVGQRGPAPEAPEGVNAWVEAQPARPDAKLVERAVATVDRVLGANSELAKEWAKSDDTAWKAALRRLRARLVTAGGVNPQ